MAIEHKRVIDIETGKAQNNVKSLKQQIKELREAMAGMEQGTEEWNAASAKLGEALHKQQEIAIAGKRAMNDFGQTMSNLAGVGAGVVAGINGITSALSLMGVEIDKDDVGMIKFTQSMMAIVQALSTVDTATKAWKGLMTSLNAMLDQKIADTAATEANTAATEQNTVASTKNAAAKGKQAGAVGENAAAMTVETGALKKNTTAAGGLRGVISKLVSLVKNAKLAFGIWGVAIAAATVLITKYIKKIKETNQAQKELRDLQKTLNQASVESTSLLKEADATLHDSNASYDQRMTALMRLKEAFPEYEAQLTKEGNLIKDNTEYLRANIAMIEQKAQASAMENSYIELLKQERDLQQEIEDIQEGRDVTGIQRFLFGDAFNGGSMETTDPLSKWLFGKGQESRISDREEELEKVQRRIKNIREEYGKLGSVMGTTKLAASWKDINNQVIQFNNSAKQTARQLTTMFNDLQKQLFEFQSGGNLTALQKLIFQLGQTLNTLGLKDKETGEPLWDKLFGKDFIKNLQETMKLAPDIVEGPSKVINQAISDAIKESGDDLDAFFDNLENNLDKLAGDADYAEELMKGFFAALRHPVTAFDFDDELVGTNSIFNPEYIETLTKKLNWLKGEYEALGNSGKKMSGEVAAANQRIVNDWNENYAKQWDKMEDMRMEVKKTQAAFEEAEKAFNDNIESIRSQTDKSHWQIEQEEEMVRRGFTLIGATYNSTKEAYENAVAILENYKTENRAVLGDIDALHDKAVKASDALSTYMFQMQGLGERATKLGFDKEELEAMITSITDGISAIKEFQKAEQVSFKNAADFIRSIVPSMVDRVKLERQYLESRKAGNKFAASDKELATLHLESEEIKLRINYYDAYLKRIELIKKASKDAIKVYETALDVLKEQYDQGLITLDNFNEQTKEIQEKIAKEIQTIAGFDQAQIDEVNKGLVESRRELNAKLNEIEDAEYNRRSENLKEYLKVQEDTYKEAYDQLELLMLENNDIWRLGSEDYNFEMEQLEAQRYFLEQKEAELESWREQDLINEIDYQEQLKAIREQYAEIDYNIQRESSNRKLKVHNTYFNALKSITSAISGIMSEAIEAEEENKEKQKELRIAQTWMTGIMASIEALASGIQAPIPAPGNYILGGILSAATIAETALAASNIQKEYGTQTSGAANINVPTYETLAYENDTEINGNIRDQRVYLVESEAMAMGQHIDTVESEAQF